MMNAINWVDVMDGLAGGVAMGGALVLFVRAYLFTQFSVALFPLALAGVCLGFLGRNRPPARIFMGSSGSLLLGFGLAGALCVAATLVPIGIAKRRLEAVER